MPLSTAVSSNLNQSSPYNNSMDKQSLRKEIKNKKRQFTSQELCELSFPVVMRLLSHPRIKTANTVMLYYSLPDEVDTHTLVDSLLMSGKRILLPRVTGEGTMELRRYTGPSDLAQGAYNIMEPTGEVFDNYTDIDLAVIPGVAFDKDGNRMGRGKGYYDRLLPKLANTYKIGICLPFQLVEKIPTDEHDVRMDEVLF
ncbi:5-formyltetrahydrofolate cyclo-ligase [uncultured Prevotella sp.]|uniref:5-formyltetrahydrofolate cyclo-ligase n=2 Tax=Prevotella TaxID=838 RepID=UPI0027E2D400|nr:5-formyltetrahydrofolate cyclo-ligase [uncultured Prevotella sp.]